MKHQNKRGITNLIAVIIVAVLVLSFFGVSLQTVFESDTSKENFSYIKTFFVFLWDEYLKKPSLYLYNDIFLPFIWEPLIENLERLSRGDSTTIEPSIPDVEVR